MRSSWLPWNLFLPLTQECGWISWNDLRWVSVEEGGPGPPPGVPSSGPTSVDHRQDVILPHQQHLLVSLELELVAGVGGEQDAIAHFHLGVAALAVLRQASFTHRQNLALLRL